MSTASSTMIKRQFGSARPEPAAPPQAGPDSDATPLAAATGEKFLTVAPRPGEALPDLLTRVAESLAGERARILNMTVFNGRAEYAAAHRRLAALFGDIAWPITWLHSEASPCDAPAGVEIHALTDPMLEVRAIRLHDRIVGTTWEDAHARYCVLGDLRAGEVNDSAAFQTRRVLEDMLEALTQAGMTIRHVYRTWFRNRDILAWYRDFNQVRTGFFNKHGVFEGVLPASTGISAANPYGAALVAGLWAMKPKSASASAFAVDSPLQDSAWRYGSSFNRAVEVHRGNLRHLTISGTASIGRDGKTMYVGDIQAQVDQTMCVVHAILNSRHMDWPDVVRGLVYCRHPTDIGAYGRWASNQRVRLPVVELNHTVCRDELLYEIEVDARAPLPGLQSDPNPTSS